MTTAGLVKSQTTACLIAMLKALKYEYVFLLKEGPNQPLNREVIAEVALSQGCTHLFFLDSDMHFPPESLNILLGHDKDVIGANYHQRQLPLITTVKMDAEKKKTIAADYPNGVFPCNAVASGFMLINTKVFAKLEKPWFHVGTLNGELEGHDYRFCRLVREAGFNVWCDLNIPIKHIGDYLY